MLMNTTRAFLVIATASVVLCGCRTAARVQPETAAMTSSIVSASAPDETIAVPVVTADDIARQSQPDFAEVDLTTPAGSMTSSYSADESAAQAQPKRTRPLQKTNHRRMSKD
jgi:hypothetical protein